ncbi:CBO0543 family protein [Alicyclobacillus dauci]|uniref:Uncharacterized protein n=1 Tax=Alicyclobacillus dauci TaxID=1475485 RepID=A0ABY6YYB7_9BACL|nr:CBO0543 family protein [Alicyclobacillus dauci]WAH35618.1 hypothetical protein NZD86_15210 [Alicyclobacillus dauci]
MHITIAAVTALAAWKWGDWRNWKKYEPTMLFMAFLAMVYEFLTKDYSLWEFHPDIIANQTTIVLLYASFTMPLTALIFLSNYPDRFGKLVVYYLMWVGIYVGVEVILYVSRRITYSHRWNLLWSVLFDVVMFPILRLHGKKPLITYIICVPIILVYLSIFKVPLK